MANKIDKFISETFGKVRGVYLDGQAWLYATDVCKCLEIKNARDAISKLEDNERMTLTSSKCQKQAALTVGNADSHSGKRGGARMYNLINEMGLYRLVFTSRKPQAREFQNWVFHEVLPSIRKYGEYRIEWEEAREGGKVIRKTLGETVKKFCEYLQARDELDRSESTWHIIFSNLVNRKLGLKDNRNNLSALQLLKISDGEELVTRIIEAGMAVGTGHHEIFEACKRKLTERDDITKLFNN